MSTIIQTGYKLAQAVISNGQTTGNPWTNPDNLLLVDGDVAASNPNNAASDVIAGNFNSNLPSTAVVTGIAIKIFGYRGAQTSPPITLTPYAVDNTNGTDVFYPYITPFTGLTESMAEYVLGGENYLFATDWTADKINNLKLQMVANGNIYLDAVQLNVFYYIPDTIDPPTPSGDACSDCNSPVQAQPFYLALPFLATQTKCYLKSFNYPNGLPIQYSDLGACGGYIDLVFDPGKPKQQGSNFEENAFVGIWTVLESGIVELDFVTLENRGRAFHTPYDHDPDLLSDHDANSQVIISNSGHYEDRFLRKCHIGILVSAPITVEDEGEVVDIAVETFNFVGPNVQAEVDGTDPKKVNVNIVSKPTNSQPEIEDANEETTGAGTDTELTVSVTVTDGNYIRAWISGDNIATSSVTHDGIPMSLIASKANVPANLKVELYELINPNPGTHDVVVTKASACHFSAGALSFTDVDTSNPIDGISAGAIGSSTGPTDTVTTTIQNTVLMDVVGTVTNATTFAQAYPWAIQSQIPSAARPGASSTRNVLIPGTVTDLYSIAPTQAWAIIIAGVRGISTPASGVDSVTGSTVDNTDPANPIINANTKIQFENEGTNLGTPGTVNEIDFVGAGVNAVRAANKITVTISGGGGTGVNSVTGLNTDNTDPANPIVKISVDGSTITGLGTPGSPLVATASSPSAITRTVSQTGHGFSANDVIKSSGTNGAYAKAKADSAADAEAVGIVTVVLSADSFVYTMVGEAILASLPGGVAAGDTIYLSSATAGLLTATAPTATGTVSKPMAVVINASTKEVLVYQYRGIINQ